MACHTDPTPDALMLNIVEQVSPEALDQIAMKYMGIRHDEILTISAAEREQITMKKLRVLELWWNRNSHLDVKKELHNILRKAQGDGLINAEVYSCLESSPPRTASRILPQERKIPLQGVTFIDTHSYTIYENASIII